MCEHGPARLLIGAHLLLLIQSALIVFSQIELGAAQIGIAATAAASAAALIWAGIERLRRPPRAPRHTTTMPEPDQTTVRGANSQWQVVAFQAGMIVLLLAGAVLLGTTAHGATSTIGRTWPVAEPDALAEIEARAARQPASIAGKFGARSGWTALKGATLGKTQTNRVRSVVPFYTLDFDLRLPGGKLLYPKGYTFNPLNYVSLPQRLVVVRPADIGWAARYAALTDWILLAAGGPEDEDALSIGERLGRPVFILEERVKQRLGLTVAPVIVRQVGTHLELTEVKPERTPARGNRP